MAKRIAKRSLKSKSMSSSKTKPGRRERLMKAIEGPVSLRVWETGRESASVKTMPDTICERQRSEPPIPQVTRIESSRASSVPTYFPELENPWHRAEFLSDTSRRTWKGFAELESEPAVFNHVLQKWGVRGVKAVDVLVLDEEAMAQLPQPIYGLIFCFRYKKDQEEADRANHLWFAHQRNSNACASVALLNVLNNVPNLNLGEHLEAFKTSTMNMSPTLRGYELGQDEHIRAVHNSFATRGDIRKGDMARRIEHDAEQNPGAKHQSKRGKHDANSENAHHYVGFIHSRGAVYKMDGMDTNPKKIGECHENGWLKLVCTDLRSRIESADDLDADDGGFNVMALVSDSVVDVRGELAAIAQTIRAVEAHLDNIKADWKSFVEDGFASTLADACIDSSLGFDDHTMQVGGIDVVAQHLLRSLDVASLLEVRNRLNSKFRVLVTRLSDGMESSAQQIDTADDAGHGYCAVTSRWLEMLASKNMLKALHEQLDSD